MLCSINGSRKLSKPARPFDRQRHHGRYSAPPWDVYFLLYSFRFLDGLHPYRTQKRLTFLHYAGNNIRMNNVLPGFCENVTMTDAAKRSIPLGRQATFDEIGQTCVFLASDASSYITGQNLMVDGGLTRNVR